MNNVLSFRSLLSAACAVALTAPAVAERNYLAWGNRHDPDSSVGQFSTDVAMDRRGNVAVAGYNTANNKETFYTARYDALTGGLIWEKSLASLFGNSRPVSVATDSQGNVIVTGYTEGFGTNADYITVKYAASNGEVLWSKIYNNPNNSEDKAVKVVVDKDDNVIVTGSSVGSGTNEDIRTFKYAREDGEQLWERSYDSPGNQLDRPADLFVDASGNVAITGRSRVGANTCFYTAKYNGTNGTEVWARTFDSLNGTDDEGVGVVIGKDGHVTATGSVKMGGSYAFHTIQYHSENGDLRWQRQFQHPSDYPHGPAAIGVDPSGNVVVAGSSALNNLKTTFYTVKYDTDDGSDKWFKRTDAVGGDDDIVRDLAVDTAGNVIVTGSTQDENQSEDFYLVKYESAEGGVLWEQRLNGATEGGKDVPAAIATDRAGNVAVTGVGRKPNTNTFEILTVKYNRFLLTVGDSIKAVGLSDEATVATLNTPSLADSGAFAARIGIKDEGKRLAAIVTQSSTGLNGVVALQGRPAVGILGASYQSFQDPVTSPNGRYAFIGKVSGVPSSKSTAVWTSAFGGFIQRVLQTGEQVPGFPTGVILKSVTSISLQDGYLSALITVSGPGYSGSKANLFLGMTSPSAGIELLRVGESINADNVSSNVKKLSVYAPTKSSPGHGRYHGGPNPRMMAVATLEDKRVVLLSINNQGEAIPLLATKGNAVSVGAGDQWKSFGLPATAANGFNLCTLAAVEKGVGDATSANDSVIMTSSTGSSFLNLVREGELSGVGDSVFTGFSDPISAPGERYGFLGTLKGTDIGGSNRVGYWLATAGNLSLVARTGNFVPDAFGDMTEAKFSALTNIALPNSGPVFLAKVKGTGVNAKNNFGLWGRDSASNLRQLLRNGDQMGEYTVKKFTLLNSVPGAYSANRAFNGTGGVAALVSFTDKTQALVYVGIP